MGPVQQLISDKLQAEYQPDVLQLTNESFMHSVPEGSESHFKLVIVSDRFQGLASGAASPGHLRPACRAAGGPGSRAGAAYLHRRRMG